MTRKARPALQDRYGALAGARKSNQKRLGHQNCLLSTPFATRVLSVSSSSTPLSLT
jgi:hypothetical protein